MKKVLLLLAGVFACLSMSLSAKTIYITNPNNWDTVKVYAYDEPGGSGNEDAAWDNRKEAVKLASGLYKYETDRQKVIFTNGNATSRYPADQQGGVGITDGKIYNCTNGQEVTNYFANYYVIVPNKNNSWNNSDGTKPDASTGIIEFENVNLGSSGNGGGGFNLNVWPGSGEDISYGIGTTESDSQIQLGVKTTLSSESGANKKYVYVGADKTVNIVFDCKSGEITVTEVGGATPPITNSYTGYYVRFQSAGVGWNWPDSWANIPVNSDGTCTISNFPLGDGNATINSSYCTSSSFNYDNNFGYGNNFVNGGKWSSEGFTNFGDSFKGKNIDIVLDFKNETMTITEYNGTSTEPEQPEQPAEKITIYYDNTSDSWSTVKAYLFVDDSNNNTWSGTNMSKVDGVIYKLEFENPKNWTKVIFNNGNGSQHPATEGWDIVDGAVYSNTGKTYNSLAEWQNAHVRKLYLTGSAINGWETNDIEMTYEGDGVYTAVVESLNGDWKIWDKSRTSDNKWAYSFGVNSSQPSLNTEKDAKFDGNNFKTSITSKVKIIFTLVDGTDNTDSKKFSKIKLLPATGRIYFIDTKDWTGNNSPQVYLYKNGKDGHAIAKNAEFPGEEIKNNTDETTQAIQKALNTTKPVYYVEVDSDKYAQVIFNSNSSAFDKQTRNLFLVENGVYYPDEDLLPSNYWSEEGRADDNGILQHLLVYPNEFASTKYNNIYLYDDAMFQYYVVGEVKDGKWQPTLDDNGDFQLNSGNDTHIDVDITYNGYVVTGNTTTTKLVPVSVGGKYFLRLALAEETIPGDATNVTLHFYTQEKDGDNYKDEFTLSGENYFSGAVYSRNGSVNDTNETVHISTLVSPKRVYLKPADDAALYIYENNAAKSYSSVRLNETTDDAGQTIYTYDNVYTNSNSNQVSKFTIWADFENTGTEGSVTTVQYGTKKNLADGNSALIPGRWEDAQYNVASSYTINNINGNNRFQLVINWENEEVYVLPMPKGTSLAVYDGNDDYNGHFRGDALTDIDLYVRHAAQFGTDEGHYAAPNAILRTAHYPGANEHVDLANFKLSEFKAVENETEVSTVKFNAPVAGVYYAVVGHNKIEDSTAGSAVNLNRTTVQVPVRVLPTPGSVGMYINNGFVQQEVVDGVANDNYHVVITNDVIDDNGNVKGSDKFNDQLIEWDPAKRVKIACWSAADDDARLAADDVNKLHVYFWFEDEDQKDELPLLFRSENTSALDVLTADEEINPNAVEYNINTATQLSSENLAKHDNKFKLQIKQNNVISRPVSVTAYSSDEELNAALQSVGGTVTGVESIETADDAEPVYYNLNGIRVNADNLTPGFYIVVMGNHSEKVCIK